jgi:nucleoside-diphosphate-sugar epimerase
VCATQVDVRDVAEAHVAAIEKGTGWGKRFLLIGGSPHNTEIARCVKAALPDELKSQVATRVNETLPPPMMGAPPPHPVLYDASPSEQLLGIRYHSVEEMIGASVSTMLENGFQSTEQYKSSTL